MLQEAKDLQNTAVTELTDAIKRQNEVTFKAPTGSGKTYMMADMMENILDNDPNVIFLVSSLSKSELAGQNYEAFLEYKEHGRFPHLDPFLINTDSAPEERITIPDNYNVYVLPRDLYHKNTKLMKGPMEAFLRHMTSGNLTGEVGLGKKIYLIKDECHQATNNLDSISDKYFDKTYNFSATPKLKRGQNPDVEITDDAAVGARLINKVVWGGEEETLDDALTMYNSIVKPLYEKKLGIVPCIIIQISNKDMADQEWNTIIQPALEKHDIQWMYIVDKDKDCKTNVRDFQGKPVSIWRKYAKKDSSPVEAIVFKLAISEGWDIRRACMLYQIRSTKSKQLDEQVLGRIRRNPILLNFEDYDEEAQNLATTAWAWGLKPIERKEHIKVELSSPTSLNEMKVRTTVLKDLTAKTGFDVAEIISEGKKRLTGRSIFDLYRDYEKANEDIHAIGKKYIRSVRDWFDFTSNLSEIIKEYNAKICDYKKSMELLTDENGEERLVTVPSESVYEDTPMYTIISDHLWKRKDSKEDFAFDSEAEMEFADLLVRMAPEVAKNDPGTTFDTYLWGKNYLSGSEIRYEYYMDGTHFSYPDFILKDNYDRMHLFEVKSLNEGFGKPSFDREAYEKKVAALKECYKWASELTGHIFYLPIKEHRSWKITRLMDGVVESITYTQLKTFLKEQPVTRMQDADNEEGKDTIYISNNISSSDDFGVAADSSIKNKQYHVKKDNSEER